MKNQIHTICLDCGRKNDKKNGKGGIGVWLATCDMCENFTWCADAQHDFGIYNNDVEKIVDRVQDLI